MHLASLYRYPVKGLTPEPLQRALAAAGQTLAFDRAWAIENGVGRFDPAAPRHLPKINFLMPTRDERLATMRTQFDDATETLTILRAGMVSGPFEEVVVGGRAWDEAQDTDHKEPARNQQCGRLHRHVFGGCRRHRLTPPTLIYAGEIPRATQG